MRQERKCVPGCEMVYSEIYSRTNCYLDKGPRSSNYLDSLSWEGVKEERSF